MSPKIGLGNKTYVLSDSEESGGSDVEATSDDGSDYEYDIDDLRKTGDDVLLGSEVEDRLNGDGEREEVRELRNVVLNILKEFKLKEQMSEGWCLVNRRMKTAEKNLGSLDDEYRKIEKKLHRLRIGFYESFRLDETFLPPLEIGPAEMFSKESQDVTEVISKVPGYTAAGVNLPPIGPLMRSPIKVGDSVYMMKYTKLSKWIPARVVNVERLPDAAETYYDVEHKKDSSEESATFRRTVSAKFLAYVDECKTRIPVGTRVIATVEGEFVSFYVGVVAENPSGANKYRYLIFFDDGYAQYAHHSDIRVVVQGSMSVWEDVATNSRDFIKDYLETYPERPLVRIQKYQYVKTELEGKWYRAQALEIDCSLVKMKFPVKNTAEWLYRGSTRLLPLYHKRINAKIKSEVPNRTVRRRTMPVRKTGPVLEYVNLEEKENVPPAGVDNVVGTSSPSRERVDYSPAPLPAEGPSSIVDKGAPTDVSQPVLPDPLTPTVEPPSSTELRKRAVARKSSASRNQVSEIPISEQLILECKGFFTTIKCPSKVVRFFPHQCTRGCVEGESVEILESKSCSPLMKPLLLGWNREFCKQKKKTVCRDVCAYVAPCGRRLRSIGEVHRYLKLTKSRLQVEGFTFEADVSIPREWEPSEKILNVKDITNNKEGTYISCVNSIDRSVPKTLIYTSERIPSESVVLNLDPSYLVCCSCEDDCSNKSACECWQLTYEAANAVKKGPQQNYDIGYKFRRLYEQVTTGIFECNSRCRCNSSCLNRVVQFQIKNKLQLFKTAKRGWGVRTVHDIPKGSFICVYVGKVLTENEANEEGMTDGADDYYANLDFIEVVESLKEGYESDVEDPEGDWVNAGESGDEEDERGRESSRGRPRKSSLVENNGSDEGKKEEEEQQQRIRRKKKEEEDAAFRCQVKPREGLETRERSSRILAKSLGGANTPALSGESGGEEDSNDSAPSGRKPMSFEPMDPAGEEPGGGGGDELFSALPALLLGGTTKSMREFYAADESVYVMDAKVTGNIGRYLNHSCNPNVFVQNVFVDTHDPRFPWISFFAGTNIRAGMELTWDYNYEVGSVPGRIKYCYCRSANCRGRLL